jgi:hypothetical protein
LKLHEIISQEDAVQLGESKEGIAVANLIEFEWAKMATVLVVDDDLYCKTLFS